MILSIASLPVRPSAPSLTAMVMWSRIRYLQPISAMYSILSIKLASDTEPWWSSSTSRSSPNTLSNAAFLSSLDRGGGSESGRFSSMLMNFSTVSPTLSSREIMPILSSVLASRSITISLITVDLPEPVPLVNRVISPCLIPPSLLLRPARQFGYGTDSVSSRSRNLSQIWSPVRMPAGFQVWAFQIACMRAFGPSCSSMAFGSFAVRLAILVLPAPIIFAAASTAFRPASSWSNARTTVSNWLIQLRFSRRTAVPLADGIETTE